MSVIDKISDLLRPLPVKGKGTVLNCVVPRQGMRNCRIGNGLYMDLNLANVIHRQIWMGCFARGMTGWLHRLLPVNGCFFDIGAHSGYFSLLAAGRVGAKGIVHAVEPTPGTYNSLVRHVSENNLKNVRTWNCALSASEGSLELYLPPEGDSRDFNVTMIPDSSWRKIDVPARRLDDCLDEWKLKKIDLMKVDVEGAESLIIEGGARNLSQGVVRHLMIEINGPRLVENGSSPADLVNLLVKLGFRPARLASGGPEVVSLDKWDLAPDQEYDRLFFHQLADSEQ